jgi:hypothetical protein
MEEIKIHIKIGKFSSSGEWKSEFIEFIAKVLGVV